MLTTSHLIQNIAAYLWPSVLILIAWYASASTIRTLGETLNRMRKRRKFRKKLDQAVTPEGLKKLHSRRMLGGKDQAATQLEGINFEKKKKSLFKRKRESETQLSSPPELMGEDLDEGTEKLFSSVDNVREDVKMLRKYLLDVRQWLDESVLRENKATTENILMVVLECTLFLSLALVSFLAADAAVDRMMDFWYVHVMGIGFFLCFILKARRLLMLIPLTFVAWFCWQAFSFITSFEQTLRSTTLLATVEVLDLKKKPKQEDENVKLAKVRITFKGRESRDISLTARNQLWMQGNVLRVSSEVLLFGGKNIASVDKVFTDEMKPADALILVKDEEVPPLYKWQDYQENFVNKYKKDLFHFLWKQLFKLKDQDKEFNNLTKIVPITPVVCTPLRKGQHFEIRLRNVGGIECHKVKAATITKQSKK